MSNLKRYLLFCGTAYYPKGGWEDYYGSYLTLADAAQVYGDEAAANGWTWFNVVDLNTGEIVWRHGYQPEHL